MPPPLVPTIPLIPGGPVADVTSFPGEKHEEWNPLVWVPPTRYSGVLAY